MAANHILGYISHIRWKSRLFTGLCIAVFLLYEANKLPVWKSGFRNVSLSHRKPGISSKMPFLNPTRASGSLTGLSQNKLSVANSDYKLVNVSEFDLEEFNMTKSELSNYLTIQASYKKRLAAFQRHRYAPKQQFITYGVPLSELRPKDMPTSGPKKIFPWTNYEGWIRPSITCAGGITCVSSNNTSEFMKSDLVVIHIRDINDKKDMPQIRPPHQIWLYFLIEPPYYTGHDLREFNGVFNWTVTYRRDADVVYPYFTVREKQTRLTELEYNGVMKKIMDSKKKDYLVAYMNSNCYASHTERLDYIAELKKYIPVDMYGKCGTLKCPRNSPECHETMSQYKFYLSMENSNCRDYITEKASQPLFDWSSVPVVMGADDPGNYEEVLPPNSYIHTSGFKSPKELAEYLLLLDANPALYEKYHRWRVTHEGTHDDMWCLICEKLQNESLPSQTYTDFIGWYNQDTCKT